MLIAVQNSIFALIVRFHTKQLLENKNFISCLVSELLAYNIFSDSSYISTYARINLLTIF